MRRIGTAGVTALALALAGCGDKAPQQAPEATTAAPDETPENAPGISLTDAVVQLPAVDGRPGVAYFTLSQGSGAARKLAAVHIDGVGRAELHESKMANGVSSMKPVTEVAIEAGKTLSFAPGGYHVMLFDIDPALKAGGTAELTISLDNGDKATAVAKIQSVGGAAGQVAGDHSM